MDRHSISSLFCFTGVILHTSFCYCALQTATMIEGMVHLLFLIGTTLFTSHFEGINNEPSTTEYSGSNAGSLGDSHAQLGFGDQESDEGH